METNWSNLFLLLREAAPAEITFEAAAPILRLAIDLGNVERDLLWQMGQDVQMLVEPPFTDGMAHLEEAANPARTIEERRQLLTNAQVKFLEYRVQEQLRRNNLRQALAEYRIGICHTLLGSQDDARKFYQAAFNSAWNFVVDMNRAMEQQDHKRRVGRNKASILGGVFAGLFYSLIAAQPAHGREESSLDMQEQITAYFLRSLKQLDGPYKIVMDEVIMLRLRSFYNNNPRRQNFAGLLDFHSSPYGR